jgi:hypothetical protein
LINTFKEGMREVSKKISDEEKQNIVLLKDALAKQTE